MFPTAVTGVPEGDNAATLSSYSLSYRQAHPTEALPASQHLPQIDSHRPVRGYPSQDRQLHNAKSKISGMAASVSEIGYNASPCLNCSGFCLWTSFLKNFSKDEEREVTREGGTSSGTLSGSSRLQTELKGKMANGI